jgi:hypothetical protein
MSLIRSSSSGSFAARAERRSHRHAPTTSGGGVGGVEDEGQQVPVSPAAQALLSELAVSGPSGEFIRRYFSALNALTLADLCVLNHALQWRQWIPEGEFSQALFWGWRRHVERMQAQRIKTAQVECAEPTQCDRTTARIEE